MNNNGIFLKIRRIVTAGLLSENPTFRLVLGMCPTLAITTTVSNCIGMGLATTAVLIMTNTVISLIRKLISDKIRIPAFITIIAGMVTIVEMFMHAYVPDLFNSLGVFIPLITVNCIILARAEMFASQNSALYSALDGLSMGLGFTLAITIIGSIREIFSAGTWLGFAVMPESFATIGIIGAAPGAFLILGLLMALVNKLTGQNTGHNKCVGCALHGKCKNEEEVKQ